jgi:hypothetical protein
MSTQPHSINVAALALPRHASSLEPTGELPESLAALTRKLGDGREAELVRHCFAALTDLLSELQTSEVCLSSDEPAYDKSLIVSVGERALALIDQLDAGTPGGLDPETEEALAGLSFALRHEVRRVLDLDLNDCPPEQQRDAYQGRLAHAHNLLVNCFRQCVLMLARSIDPDFEEPNLFDDAEPRLAESVKLRDALVSLIATVKEAERGHFPQSAVAVVAELDAFRGSTMRYLMRRDWEMFDSFASEIISTRVQAEFKGVAKKFVAYLETLLAHVQMRSVFNAQTSPDAPAETRATALGILSRAARSSAAWSVVMAVAVFVCGLFFFFSRSRVENATLARKAAPQAVDARPVKEEETQSSAPAPTTPSVEREGNLTVQLGAYKDEAAAVEAATSLKARGVEARVTRASRQGMGVVFRVQSGFFNRREEAARFGDRLKSSGIVRTYLIATGE